MSRSPDAAAMNPEQQRAIEHGDGPLLILAGAGSGKSRVIVNRIARLVERGVEPWKILAVTFTNKAAAEMRHRLWLLLGELTEAMWIGTFHATCARILRKHASVVGLDSSFTIFDDDDQTRLIEKLLREGENEDKITARAVLSRIDRAKNRGEDPAQMKTGSFDDVIEQIYPLYQDQLRRENAVDFNDLILKTLELFKHSETANFLRHRFRHVLVDEFQDTNTVQYDLVKSFLDDSQNLAVVGDDDQCHPPGTLIDLNGDNRVPIEKVKKGDLVVTYADYFWGYSKKTKIGRKVRKVSSRPYTGDIITIKAGGESVRVTPNHRIPTKFSASRDRWAIYLMEKGTVSRVGCCRLMYKAAFGPAMRARHELADKLWILTTYEDKEKTHIEETLIALRFGLPERVFAENYIVKAKLLAAIGNNRDRAIRCLKSFGRLYEYPLYQKCPDDGSGNNRYGRYVRLTQACNLIDGASEVRTSNGTQAGGSWEPVRTSRKKMSTRVYSLSVDVADRDQNHRLYVADRILVHNSIYAWRGAEPKNLLEFDQDFPNAAVIKLEQNYRSTQNVLDAAYAVIRRNKNRHDKRLWTEQGPGAPYRVYTAIDERDEARFVAREIKWFLSDKKIRPKDIAILYRTNAQARVFEELLRTTQVESKVVGAQSFFERKEIKDVIAYLRVLANQKADSACERIINVPARGIGEATLEKLRTYATKHAVGLLGAARAAAKGELSAGIKPATQRKLTSFVALIDDLDNFSKQGMSMAQIVVAVIERSNLRGKLEADESADSRERLDNLADLVTIASDTDHEARTSPADAKLEAATAPATGEPVEVVPAAAAAGKCTMCNGDGQPCSWCEGEGTTSTAKVAEDKPRTMDEPQSIQAFLERVALSAPSDIGNKPVDAVSLMTIHIAKGLEWPIVFVVGLEDGLFPSIREREGTSEADSMEEERRLMYVAITRAREHLIISHARTRRQWGETKPQTPSRFLADLPEQG